MLILVVDGVFRLDLGDSHASEVVVASDLHDDLVAMDLHDVHEGFLKVIFVPIGEGFQPPASCLVNVHLDEEFLLWLRPFQLCRQPLKLLLTLFSRINFIARVELQTIK